MSNNHPRSRRLGAADFTALALPVLQSVFASLDPFEGKCRPDGWRRVLAYPVVYSLRDTFLDEVIAAVRLVGDDSFYFAYTEGPTDAAGYPQEGWLIACDDLGPYLELDGQLESCLCSTRSRWGILISHEWHAVVCGEPAFIDRVGRSPLASPEAIAKFVGDVRDASGTTPDWLTGLLVRVYGREVGERVLASAV